MAIQFCKSCQQNNVNTRVEWLPNPDPTKTGNKPFDVDKQEWHKCKYFDINEWRKSKQNKTDKIKLKPEDQAAMDKFETDAKLGSFTAEDVADIKRTLIKIEEQTGAILTFLQNKMGWEKGNEVK